MTGGGIILALVLKSDILVFYFERWISLENLIALDPFKEKRKERISISLSVVVVVAVSTVLLVAAAGQRRRDLEDFLSKRTDLQLFLSDLCLLFIPSSFPQVEVLV